MYTHTYYVYVLYCSYLLALLYELLARRVSRATVEAPYTHKTRRNVIAVRTPLHRNVITISLSINIGTIEKMRSELLLSKLYCF